MGGDAGGFKTSPAVTRRAWVAWALAAGGPAGAAGSAAQDAARSRHFPFGAVVPPRPVSAWPVLTQAGTATDLATLLRGRVTAVQLMFTGCSAVCPIQGALFAQAQRELGGAANGLQLLSISIDALADSPQRLADWLNRHGAGAGWSAAVPRTGDVAAITDWLDRGGEARRPGDGDNHPGQVYLLDRRGDLVYRLRSLARAADIVAGLRAVAQRP